LPFARLADGSRIHYADRGERRPDAAPALLVHGAGASSAIWMMVLARLASATRAVAVDLPGHGPSPAGPRAPSSAQPCPSLIEAYRDAVGQLAAALCLGPSVLVGHSMGALVAMQAALAWPDKVRGLVLCAAAPRMPVSDEGLAVIREDHARFPAWLADHALSPRARPAVRRGFVAAGIVTSRETTLADFEAVRAADLRAGAARIACPVVWLDGADDAIVGRASDPRPGVAHALPDVGHLVPIEAPAAVASHTAALARA